MRLFWVVCIVLYNNGDNKMKPVKIDIEILMIVAVIIFAVIICAGVYFLVERMGTFNLAGL